MSTIVLDNGANTLKVGKEGTAVQSIPNCIFRSKNERRKNFISNQIDSCKDFSSLFFLLPFQKGYLLNWDVQRQVWDVLFGRDNLNLKCNETSLVITEPHFNFSSIQEAMNEIFFEEYEFKSLLRTNPSTLSCHQYLGTNPEENCCLIVDSGFSFTHIAPYYQHKKITEGVCRIDVGGKLLSNHLKEVISYQQLQVMDETYVMNQAKEDSCFVSMDFHDDMNTCKKKGVENTIVKDYILPDYTNIKRGFLQNVEVPSTDQRIKTQEQKIRLSIERFRIPEILFHPSDIGISQMGLAEAILYSISKCPSDLQPHMLRNIVLTGGNCLFPNFLERLTQDVRSLAPDYLEVDIHLPKNPITYACEGGLQWAKDGGIAEHWLTVEEYQEGGQSACARQFSDI